MAKANVQIKGEARVRADLSRYSSKTQRNVKIEVDRWGKKIQADARRNAPVDTGNLRRSIKESKANNGFTSVVKVDAEYGVFVEYGTSKHFPPTESLEGWARRKLGNEKLAFLVARKIFKKGTPAQPFLFPAFEKNRKKFIRAVKAVLKRG